MANVTCVVSASLLKLGNSGEGEVRLPVRKRRDEDLIAGSIVGCGRYNHIVSGRSDSTVPYLSNTLTSLGSAFRRTGPYSLVPSNLGQVGGFDATLLFLGVGNALGHSATPATRRIAFWNSSVSYQSHAKESSEATKMLPATIPKKEIYMPSMLHEDTTILIQNSRSTCSEHS